MRMLEGESIGWVGKRSVPGIDTYTYHSLVCADAGI